MAASEVAFEVERVGWPSPDRLEVVGRWFGVRGRRFIRPTLYVDADGEPRRLLAVLDHKPWAVEDGQEWIAAFAWEGDPVDVAGSELTVGPGIAVELAPPGERRPGGRRFARQPRADVLGSELAGEREKAQRLSRELHSARADHAADIARTAHEHATELERLRAERAEAEQDAERRVGELRGELDAARDRVARLETALRKARDELAVARADVAAQRPAEEVERLRLERDAARAESAQARGERDAAIRDRDRARQERQVLLTRVRTEGERRRAVPAPPTAREQTPTFSAPPIVSATPPPRGPALSVAVVVGLAVVTVLLVVLLLVFAL